MGVQGMAIGENRALCDVKISLHSQSYLVFLHFEGNNHYYSSIAGGWWW